MAHLWEYDHPFYGDGGQHEELSSLAELQQALAGHPHDGSTVIYRWDWLGPHSRGAEPDRREELVIYGLFPRKSMTWSLSCPISKDQEDEVRAWLGGPDVLGQLAPEWAPVLGGTATAAESQEQAPSPAEDDQLLHQRRAAALAAITALEHNAGGADPNPHTAELTAYDLDLIFSPGHDRQGHHRPHARRPSSPPSSTPPARRPGPGEPPGPAGWHTNSAASPAPASLTTSPSSPPTSSRTSACLATADC